MKFYDRAKMTVSGAPGTGVITLGSAAVVGGQTWLTFAQAGVQDKGYIAVRIF